MLHNNIKFVERAFASNWAHKFKDCKIRKYIS